MKGKGRVLRLINKSDRAKSPPAKAPMVKEENWI